MPSRVVAAWTARVANTIGTIAPFLTLMSGSRNAPLVGPIPKAASATWCVFLAARAAVTGGEAVTARRARWTPFARESTLLATGLPPLAAGAFPARSLTTPAEPAARALARSASRPFAESAGPAAGSPGVSACIASTLAPTGRPLIHPGGETTSLERHAVHLVDDGCRIGGRDLRHGVAIANLELAD